MIDPINRNRKLINEYRFIDLEYNSLKEALDTIKQAIKDHGEDWEICRNNPYTFSDTEEIQIRKSRLENDKEYYERITAEERVMQHKNNNEREMYEELKKKFG